MNEPKRYAFLDVFSDQIPQGELRKALKAVSVLSIRITREQRRMNVILEHPLSSPIREQAEAFLTEAYDLREVTIQGAAAETDGALFEWLKERFVQVFPPASALLCKARLEERDGRFVLRLPDPGRELLSTCLPSVEKELWSRIGRESPLILEAVNPENKQTVFQKSEELRRKAILKSAAAVKKPAGKKNGKKAIYGRVVQKEPVSMESLHLDLGTVTVQGRVFAVHHKELKKRGASIISFDMTDDTGSVRVTKFMLDEEARPIVQGVKRGQYLTVQGRLNLNRFDNDMVLEPMNIFESEGPHREDMGTERRVELHLHTRYSAMDGLTDVKKAVERAVRWGHKAIAITDHGVVQAFPDAAQAAKGKDIKILYGMEAYYIDDVASHQAVHGNAKESFEGEYVCFDLETTGLLPSKDEITEIGAVVLRNGQVEERYHTYVNPKRPLPREISRLTGITDDMLKDAPTLEEALPQFFDFVGGRVLAAHNADFDISFLEEGCLKLSMPFAVTYLDTLILSRILLPHLSKYKLNVVAEHLKLPSFTHHRATDDAATVAYMLMALFPLLRKQGAARLEEINGVLAGLKGKADNHPRHLTILAQNQTGLRNLYQLVSMAHLKHFRRVPVIPRSLLSVHREGLLLGSACENGELFRAITGRKNQAQLRRIASFYDFLEIMPLCNNYFMLDNGMAESEEELKEFNETVVQLGKELKKPVAATGDVHFLDPEDEIHRRILLASKKFEDADRSLPLYFKTTDEMLEEFSYLGEDVAREVVITAPNRIADLCDSVQPLPQGLFAPKMEGAEEELRSIVWGRAKELYGDPPPPEVSTRLETELKDIIGSGYAVIYMTAQKLVSKSLEDGYLVGSRGSVGSSLVAFMAGITEVNALSPHYRCPNCKHSEFLLESTYGCGADMPDKNCPVCGVKYEKDGFQIPFETFLGFGGDKLPDIDLNFSGEYQAKAHRHTFDLFGEHHVFRAGTIGTVAEKTAFGFVKKYLEERGKTVSSAEENRLVQGCVGVKRTTGQHPGGLVVVPRDKEIYDFCPVQHPADDTGTDIITTHFEYHSMESNLLKLDLLGHDDPTMIRMLQDLTGVDPRKIPLDDPGTRSIFTSSKVLGFENDPILGPTGACAIPEFGTRFVRGMLLDTMPTQFDTLVRISGFSHGTDVWLGNAREYILSGTAGVNEVIGCRDDIMLYLIRCGLDERLSFQIMEAVRKNKPLQPEWIDAMKNGGVPQWYIDSCNKIQYLFPKAHAVAYVVMAFRIAWFKVHRPLAFYAAYFTIRAKAFDAAFMTRGMETVKAKMKELERRKDLTAVEEEMMVTLEVCYEFYLRGFTFQDVSLYRSDAVRFLMDGNSLIPPFVAISGLGETAARNIVECRGDRKFISVEEFSAACPKVSKTHIEQLRALGALDGMPDTSQITLF